MKSQQERAEMDEEIKDLCRRLRLPGIYQSYQTIAEDCTHPEEFLVRILTAEVRSREASRRERALQQAGFPAYKRFEEIKPDMLPSDGREYFERIQNLDFIRENRNVILIGNSGTGKTHLAIAAGITACENGYSVRFRSAAGLINDLKEAKNEIRLSKFEKAFRKTDLVIIDELGYISFDEEGAELLFQFLALRYEHKSTIITTNLTFSDWVKVFHDRAITAAILDRITHHAMILNMSGQSFRQR
jgi:DNA replication protein DnaC